MPKAKLKLSELEAGKMPTIHSLVGTSTVDAFKTGNNYIVTISGRSAEQLVEVGRLIETVTPEDVAAFKIRDAKAKEVLAQKAASSSVKGAETKKK